MLSRTGKGETVDGWMLISTGALIGVLAGYGTAWYRAGSAEPDRAAVPVEPVETYLNSMSEFGDSVIPLWSGHIQSSRDQMEAAVNDLTAKFATIVTLLDDALGSSRGSAGN